MTEPARACPEPKGIGSLPPELWKEKSGRQRASPKSQARGLRIGKRLVPDDPKAV